MHYGNIDRDTAAARVLRVLRQSRGWIDSWSLSQRACVVAVGTRVSEIRAQGVPVECQQIRRRFYYRIGGAA